MCHGQSNRQPGERTTCDRRSLTCSKYGCLWEGCVCLGRGRGKGVTRQLVTVNANSHICATLS